MVLVLGQIETSVFALRLVLLALGATNTVHAYIGTIARMVTCSTVIGVCVQIDAYVSTLILSGWADELAFPIDAQFAVVDFALFLTVATMGIVALKIETLVATDGQGTAVRDAKASLADKTRRALFAS